MMDPISEFASVYCRPDRYSEQHPDRFYSVYSLYFDSPDSLFFRKRMEGAENRSNMRIRTYEQHGEAPCFLEVKQKREGIIRKYRTRVVDESWRRILESSECGFPGCEEKEKAGLFVRLACSYGASPKVLCCYRRKAWVSDVDGYGRVTFDRELQGQIEVQCNLIPDPCRMNAWDNSTVFDPECSIVLELKCYAGQVPSWMLDLIRYFDLRRSRFSKYVNSVKCALGQCGYDRADRMAMTGC